MWSKPLRLSLALLLALVLLLCAAPGALAAAPEETDIAGEVSPVPAEAEPMESESEPEPVDLLAGVEVPALLLRSEGSGHTSLLHGYGDGTFRPAQPVTRAEGAQMFCSLLAEVPEFSLPFTDITAASWYYPAAGVVTAAGLPAETDGAFRPDAPLTRGEFVTVLAALAPATGEVCAFTDLGADDPLCPAVSKAVAAGWINGYPDGSFRAEATLTRAEATVLICRVLGRSADRSYTANLIFSPYTDVTPACWAFDAILEASVDHEANTTDADHELWMQVDDTPLRRTPGLYFVGLDQYYIGPDGYPVTDTTVGTLYYGPDGRYTSGNAVLDGYVRNALRGIVTGNMSREARLRAAYNYTRDSYTYLRRNYYAMGDNSYTEQEALTMFSTGRGNCYCFASVFYYLSRQLGYDGMPISGTVGNSRSPHGWVEIDMGGVIYIFDTELEMAYRLKGLPHDFFKMPYSAIPWPYEK